LPVLARQQNEVPHASQIRFAQRLQGDAAMVARLLPDELAAWQRLADGPVDVERANMEDRALAKAIARLERKGLAIYSGFTPSDAAHVLGLSGHWNTEAAVLGARIWARQMRHLYGLGTWTQGDATAPARQVVDKVIATIHHKLIEAGLNDAGQMNENNAGKIAGLLAAMAMQGAAGPAAGSSPSVFSLRFAPHMPLVAVGAPASIYYPAVARGLGVALELPPFAGVANAVGAVLGRVSQRVHVTVTQPVRGVSGSSRRPGRATLPPWRRPSAMRNNSPVPTRWCRRWTRVRPTRRSCSASRTTRSSTTSTATCSSRRGSPPPHPGRR
jgi:N-methylhydantoinase A/oxoprolinase/acetone carboxylase beta subunit